MSTKDNRILFKVNHRPNLVRSIADSLARIGPLIPKQTRIVDVLYNIRTTLTASERERVAVKAEFRVAAAESVRVGGATPHQKAVAWLAREAASKVNTGRPFKFRGTGINLPRYVPR